ncbi:type I restriction-modification system subunit M N-terminal domain-containing protein [Saccharicrinis aurantiacus]|uniref:type I restriction-modification system subunit M N-terminal domain-containing protein n=1 Tax=Saccharicrinis aurantiacus TaxID=1849719 RepID=UPI00094F50A5|nr:type I restriction-modification system subunit M N-terminal domain-containing protein [Saccharicrinis aurantiacus]
MTSQHEQQFLNELDKKLWTSADNLRSRPSDAEYKHAVLDLIFVQYVSDAFQKRRVQLEENLKDENHDNYLPNDFDSNKEYSQEAIDLVLKQAEVLANNWSEE